ncbi:MAG: hypothetical protein MO852_00630 [Candidatus Devosia euplotis]|nr:hypothetical protein [Candidatus Devosia euplotis]
MVPRSLNIKANCHDHPRQDTIALFATGMLAIIAVLFPDINLERLFRFVLMQG